MITDEDLVYLLITVTIISTARMWKAILSATKSLYLEPQNDPFDAYLKDWRLGIY